MVDDADRVGIVRLGLSGKVAPFEWDTLVSLETTLRVRAFLRH